MLSKISSTFGHVIEETGLGVVYQADGAPVDFACPRACVGCGVQVRNEGHDPCIADLPGTVQACCGHGLELTPVTKSPNGYVGLRDGRLFRFPGNVGGERIRLAVQAALDGQPLPEGFTFQAQNMWWEGLSDARRLYVHSRMRSALAELVRDVTGASTVDDDIVSGAKMWFDQRSDAEKEIVRSRVPAAIVLLVQEACKVA